MSVFTDSELKRFYREAAMALREMHRDEYGRILAAIKAREQGRKIAAGNIQSPLVAVAREIPKPRQLAKPKRATRRPGRPRCDAWNQVEQIRQWHEDGVPLDEQAEMLGIDRRTLEKIRASEGLRYYAPPHLPAAPLLRLLARRSLSYGSERALLISLAEERGVTFDSLDQAVNRAKLSGWVTERMAERLAHYLGRRVEDLWEREAS